jgi:hypothetical protein
MTFKRKLGMPLGTAPFGTGVAKARPLPIDPGYAGGEGGILSGSTAGTA